MNIAKPEKQIRPDLAEIRAGHRKAQILAAATAGACLWLAILIPLFSTSQNYSAFYWFTLWRQDLFFAFAFILVCAIPFPKQETPLATRWLGFLATPAGLFIVCLSLVLLCWLGRHFVYLDYNLSRDEQMADFDAYIFAHGRLFWPLPKLWQAHAPALNQLFILAIGDHRFWVSAYLPINAAIRALVSLLVPVSLTSPLLVAMGAVSLWRIAKRLWPNSSSACGVALLLYAGSAQILVNGMTSYAMTGHLALDLVWLDLFLLNKRWSHLGALAVGFFATGLHQPLFHPLFVLPFLELLFMQRRWRTLAFYLAGYALWGAFWFAWPRWIGSHGAGTIVPLDPATPDYLRRFVLSVRPVDIGTFWLTAINLVRFVTWQHLLLLPLMAVGVKASWNHDPLGRALTKSFLLTVAAMTILLPFQGHGWGYRYVHGVLGSCCLLACYGWVALESRGLSPRRMLAWTTAATFLVVLPARSVMAHQMVAPSARVSQAIDNSPAGFAIVDDLAAPFARDLVINRPDLSNRPIRLMASELRASDIREICARGSIAFFGGTSLKPVADFFGVKTGPTRNMADLEHASSADNCSVSSDPQRSH